MQADKELMNAVIEGTKEILTGQGFEVNNLETKVVKAGDIANQITILLSFKTDVTGIFCFKCSIEFGVLFCEHLFGDPGRDNDNELLQESLSELLNWISGGIQRNYADIGRVDISTPSIFIIEDNISVSQSNEDATLITFNCNSHKLSMEIMLDGDHV